jgi:hypothetical protein
VRRALARHRRPKGVTSTATLRLPVFAAAQPAHPCAVGRFDEILYLVEKTSALTLPDPVRCHVPVTSLCAAKLLDCPGSFEPTISFSRSRPCVARSGGFYQLQLCGHPRCATPRVGSPGWACRTLAAPPSRSPQRGAQTQRRRRHPGPQPPELSRRTVKPTSRSPSNSRKCWNFSTSES